MDGEFTTLDDVAEATLFCAAFPVQCDDRPVFHREPRLVHAIAGGQAIMNRIFENKTFDQIRVGDSASLQQTLTQRDLRLWSALTGNLGLDEDLVPARADHKLGDVAVLDPDLLYIARPGFSDPCRPCSVPPICSESVRR